MQHDSLAIAKQKASYYSTKALVYYLKTQKQGEKRAIWHHKSTEESIKSICKDKKRTDKKDVFWLSKSKQMQLFAYKITSDKDIKI